MICRHETSSYRPNLHGIIVMYDVLIFLFLSTRLHSWTPCKSRLLPRTMLPPLDASKRHSNYPPRCHPTHFYGVRRGVRTTFPPPDYISLACYRYTIRLRGSEGGVGAAVEAQFGSGPVLDVVSWMTTCAGLEAEVLLPKCKIDRF